jgi:hypothetical protein
MTFFRRLFHRSVPNLFKILLSKHIAFFLLALLLTHALVHWDIDWRWAVLSAEWPAIQYLSIAAAFRRHDPDEEVDWNC